MKKVISIVSTFATILIFSVSAFSEGNNTNTPPTTATAAVSGKVLDNTTGETLAGVVVSVEGTELKVYTDLDGNFTINNMEPGTYNLIVSMISYKKSLVENIKLQPNEEEIMDIKLGNE